MKNRIHILLTIIFTLVVSAAICQDIIIKKDSTQLSTKLIDTNQTELKYKLFNYQDGPVFIISKNDVAYVTFENGEQEIYNIQNKIRYNSIDSSHLNIINPQVKYNLGDYIKFNIQAGIVVNSLNANYSRQENSQSHTSSEQYSPTNKKYIYNFNLGFNFLFGTSQYIKHIIGVNYLRSTGEYNYTYYQGGYTSYYQNFHYISKIDFINIVTGLRFKIFKNLYIETLVAINITAHSNIRYSGYSTTTYISGGPTPSVYKEEIEYYSDNKVNSERANINSTVSLCPKISYDFFFKKQRLGVYISYNLAYKFKLPWMMAGITYYPFKKLK